MHSRPHWNLQVHDDTELEALLGEPLASREPLHSWPLSSVELLRTVSGQRLVYKIQGEPTVEPEFLARADSPLLPTCWTLRRDTRQANLLLPFYEEPTLKDVALDDAGLAQRGRELVGLIGGLGDDLPVYRDLGSVDAWRAFARETLELLKGLVDSGAFARVSRDDVAWLARWTEEAPVREAVARTSQLIHGDLKAEHVFCKPDGGYRIIDWQRPYRAPGEIDLVLFLESRGVAPEGWVEPAVIGLRAFLLIHWAAEAKANLLPHLPFFDTWALSALDTIRANH